MKNRTHFVCQSCGSSFQKWLGKCAGCGLWNTLVEEPLRLDVVSSYKPSGLSSFREGIKSIKQSEEDPKEPKKSFLEQSIHWEQLDLSNQEDAAHLVRHRTRMGELDRVLGGGLVRDSFVLLGGDPGIGKSTLLLQMAEGLTREKNLKVFYISGEESTQQLRLRAHRLGLRSTPFIFLAAETELEKVLASVQEIKPDVLIFDSLQTFTTSQLESAAGSVSQVREVAARLMILAKTAGIAVFLVGHVTKEGGIAGPKVIEHMVDTVLYFEGDQGQNYRLLRTVKNRFGSSKELGVFEMVGEGLKEVANPSSLFLAEHTKPVSGTAVAVCLEGTRPLLVEVQALTSRSSLPMPRRTAVGLDPNRLALIAAVLERHMSLSLSEHDLFFNVAGGLRLSEPASDLAAAAAIWSSRQSIAIPADMAFVGEIGLTGEIRRISQPDIRIQEARKLGFKKIVLPNSALERSQRVDGIEFIPVVSVSELKGILS